jgi:hypothetical protein
MNYRIRNVLAHLCSSMVYNLILRVLESWLFIFILSSFPSIISILILYNLYSVVMTVSSTIHVFSAFELNLNEILICI